MSWEIVIKFIRPELFILIIFIWTLGLFLKKAPWFKEEWSIPFILLAISIVFTVLYVSVVIGEGFSAAVIVASIIQGVIIAAVAVFSNESMKQLLVKRIDDRKDE